MALKDEEEKLFGNEPPKPGGGEPPKPGETPPAAVKPLETKLDGDEVPVEYRGKSVIEILEELKTTKSKAEDLERRVNEPPKPAEPPRPQGQMTMEDLQKLSYTDPLKASAILFQTMSEPLVKELRGTGERFAKQEISKKEHFKRYEKEINEVAGKLDPSLRTNPEAWERCYDIVVGRHVSEIVEEVKQGSTSISGSNPPPPQKEKVVLTEEQKQIAGQLGLKEEEYIAGIPK